MRHPAPTVGAWIADGTGTPRWEIVRTDGTTVTYLHNGAEQSERLLVIEAMGFRIVPAAA